MQQFPRTEVAGVSLPRMLIGSNWIRGHSHKSAAMDAWISERYAQKEAFWPVLETFLNYGIDAAMAGFSTDRLLVEAIREAEQRAGKKIILIDTPGVNMNDSTEGRREAEAQIKACADAGATFCLILHSSVEQLVNKNKRIIDRLPDYTKMIRDHGMIPGLSAHMPEIIIYSDENEYDVQTYIQIYNCLGFLMQVEIEQVARIIHHAKKPVMTIKPMAAGRTTPYIGLNFAYNTLRDCDMVTVGAYDAREAAEDVEIGLAAIDRRYPAIKMRSSTSKQALFDFINY